MLLALSYHRSYRGLTVLFVLKIPLTQSLAAAKRQAHCLLHFVYNLVYCVLKMCKEIGNVDDQRIVVNDVIHVTFFHIL